ncbi:MAG: N-6 DNA methylase, partial [bacterium]
NDIFSYDERIEINSKELSFIISKIENYSLLSASRDVIGDAFEELISVSFRGGEGQFFTPKNVVQMMVEVLEPKSGEKILDPACGSGGFLAYVLKFLLKNKSSDYSIIGIDKDDFLAKLSRIYLTLIGNSDYSVFCENSLDLPSNWGEKTQTEIKNNFFDVILTNPPFGAKIPVVGKSLLAQYEFGYNWEKSDEGWKKTDLILDKQPPQILFIERCMQLLKDGGRMGIVLPEGIFGNPSGRYIWEYILQNASIIGVVSLSQETFQPSTHTKTSILFLKKTKNKQKPIFMAIANAVGHNKNGKVVYKIEQSGNFLYDKNGEKIINDDLPEITENCKKYLKNNLKKESRFGFSIGKNFLNDHIFIPEYYNPEIKKEIEIIKSDKKYEVFSVGELVSKKILQIKRGNEIGSQFYGTGEVPFVRTSDIVNWEIKFDPVKAVSDEIYENYRKQQDILEKDILFVNDGTFLIGRTAMITKLDVKCIIQSHVRKIRVLDDGLINPYYLFYLLNSKFVRKQIDSKTFVQATISTIGNRLNEVILPIVVDKKEQQRVSSKIQKIIEEKTILREKTVEIIQNSI